MSPFARENPSLPNGHQNLRPFARWAVSGGFGGVPQALGLEPPRKHLLLRWAGEADAGAGRGAGGSGRPFRDRFASSWTGFFCLERPVFVVSVQTWFDQEVSAT